MTSNPKLRLIEEFRTSAGVRASVFKSNLGGDAVVIIEAGGEPAEVCLNTREANDLRLWLECALTTPETTESK